MVHTKPPEMVVELRRLGLLASGDAGTIDEGALAAALCEAFGGEEWRGLAQPAVVERLRRAQPPRGTAGHHRPRYAALCHDGVIECVIALGFDDAADRQVSMSSRALNASGRVARLASALRARGYVEGAAAATALVAPHRRAAADDGISTWLSRADALVLSSPAGGARAAAMVVRIVANLDGRQGEAAAETLLDGLRLASICVYSGHARYGLGPDFDPALALDVDADLRTSGPRELARRAALQARRRATSIERVLDDWLAAGAIRIDRSNASRAVLGRQNWKPGNPTARLVHWIASRSAGAAPLSLVGPTGVLAGVDSPVPHRIWLLQCCRSARLVAPIRSTPGLNVSALRVVGYRDDTGPEDLRKLPWLLDAISAGRSWEEIVRALADCGGEAAERRLVVDGIEQDPIIP